MILVRLEPNYYQLLVRFTRVLCVEISSAREPPHVHNQSVELPIRR
jgi:hypothetical protein